MFDESPARQSDGPLHCAQGVHPIQGITDGRYVYTGTLCVLHAPDDINTWGKPVMPINISSAQGAMVAAAVWPQRGCAAIQAAPAGPARGYERRDRGRMLLSTNNFAIPQLRSPVAGRRSVRADAPRCHHITRMQSHIP